MTALCYNSYKLLRNRQKLLEENTSFPHKAAAEQTVQVSTADFQRVTRTVCDSIHSSASLPSPPSNANGGFSPRRRTRCQPADTGPARGAGWAGDNFPTFSNCQLDLLPSIFHRQKSHPGSCLTPQLCHPQTSLGKAVPASRN